MRNWNSPQKQQFKQYMFRLLLYLWGIETVSTRLNPQANQRFYFTYEELKPQHFVKLLKRCLSSFYFTYEELKPKDMIESNKVKKAFLLYLWGIETQRTLALLRRSVRVFTLPMRNWNYSFLLIYHEENVCFYFTYEELKPKNVKRFLAGVDKFLLYLWGIETAIFLFRSSPAPAGFYFTYEELKLCFLYNFFKFPSKFLLYLWGIETMPHRLLRQISPSVFTLPMRNWNATSHTRRSVVASVFTLPMRNWNPTPLLTVV